MLHEKGKPRQRVISKIAMASEAVNVKHVTADSEVVCPAKSKNHAHFVQSCQIVEMRGRKIVRYALQCYLLSLFR